MYKAMLDGVGSSIENNLMAASTFNCRILGFRVLFPVLQHILIVALFHFLKQAAWKKLQKKRKSSSSVSVVSINISLRLGYQCFAKSFFTLPSQEK